MITARKGNKHPKDKIILINGHQLTFRELAKICVIYVKNEDNIYPKPRFQGGDYLINFLTECMHERDVSIDLLKKYELDWSSKSGY